MADTPAYFHPHTCAHTYTQPATAAQEGGAEQAHREHVERDTAVGSWGGSNSFLEGVEGGPHDAVGGGCLEKEEVEGNKPEEARRLALFPNSFRQRPYPSSGIGRGSFVVAGAREARWVGKGRRGTGLLAAAAAAAAAAAGVWGGDGTAGDTAGDTAVAAAAAAAAGRAAAAAAAAVGRTAPLDGEGAERT